jgi:hypothetical protein
MGECVTHDLEGIGITSMFNGIHVPDLRLEMWGQFHTEVLELVTVMFRKNSHKGDNVRGTIKLL